MLPLGSMGWGGRPDPFAHWGVGPQARKAAAKIEITRTVKATPETWGSMCLGHGHSASSWR